MRFEKRKKNGKLPEKCRKKNGNFKKRKWTDPFFQISVFFPFFFRFFLYFRFFSGFFPFFKNAIRFLYQILETKKTDKKRTKDGILKFYFPYFFRHFLKNPEKCRKKMVLFFSGNLRLCPFLGQKRNVMPEKIRKIPLRIKTGTATCGFFHKNFVFLEKKLKKRKKTVIRF